MKVFLQIILFWIIISNSMEVMSQGNSSCNCTEYIYLNEPGANSVLKFKVNAGVALTEVLGTNGGPHWYPGTGTSQVLSPHGLAADLNGNLYIGGGDPGSGNTYQRKFNCDGALQPIAGNTIAAAAQNTFSIGNTLYTNFGPDDNLPVAWDLCSGAFLGKMCLNDATYEGGGGGDNLWGMSYNETTEMVYVTRRYNRETVDPNAVPKVWVFTRAQLEAGIAGTGACIDPIITLGPNAIVNPGEKYLPNIPGQVMGITSDNTGNMFIVAGFGATSYILKYNAAGQFISQSVSGPPGSPFWLAIGIVWSESTNRLYLSQNTDNPLVNCISAFDATTMAYVGTAAPNPALPSNDTGKAIAIIKECCPSGLPSTFTKYICGGNGAKFYLNQEAFNTCGGVVCGSSWMSTSLSGMTFDPCDNSVTITSNGCSTFTLNLEGVTSTNCPSQNSTFTICNSLPPTVTVNVSSPCNIVNNHHSISGIINMPAPPLAGTMTISVTGGVSQTYNAPFNMPIMYNFNGLNSDGGQKAVTVSFSEATSCNTTVNYVSPAECLCNISAQATAIECLDNGTPFKFTDNRIRFNALISNNNPNLNRYDISINGGTTITPNTNIPYGVTQFVLGQGTAGGGATFTITVTDRTIPGCTRTFQVVDPGNCNNAIPCTTPNCGAAPIQLNGN